MQISAVTPSFNGRYDNIDAMIGMDDNSIRKIAYLQTSEKVDRKKNRKITNALFYSAPLAAGLATTLLSNNGNTKIFSKSLTGVAGRMAKGLKVAALWTADLGAVDLLGVARNKLAQKSPEVRNFDKEHPIASMVATLAAGIGIITLVSKGAVKLGQIEAPKFMQKGTAKVAKFLNENKAMVGLKNAYLNISEKMHPALKEIGATALDWAPTALLLGGLFHSVSSAGAENREFAKNYNNLKNEQVRLSQARVRELSVQNDFLMQDAQNREDIELLKNPMAGLDEV